MECVTLNPYGVIISLSVNMCQKIFYNENRTTCLNIIFKFEETQANSSPCDEQFFLTIFLGESNSSVCKFLLRSGNVWMASQLQFQLEEKQLPRGIPAEEQKKLLSTWLG